MKTVWWSEDLTSRRILLRRIEFIEYGDENRYYGSEFFIRPQLTLCYGMVGSISEYSMGV